MCDSMAKSLRGGSRSGALFAPWGDTDLKWYKFDLAIELQSLNSFKWYKSSFSSDTICWQVIDNIIFIHRAASRPSNPLSEEAPSCIYAFQQSMRELVCCATSFAELLSRCISIVFSFQYITTLIFVTYSTLIFVTYTRIYIIPRTLHNGQIVTPNTIVHVIHDELRHSHHEWALNIIALEKEYLTLS